MDEQRLVRCATHGLRDRVIACVHVQREEALELFLVPADDEDDTLVWCAQCEKARIADKGWYDNADAIAQWAFICSGCLERILQASQQVTSFKGEVTPEQKPNA